MEKLLGILVYLLLGAVTAFLYRVGGMSKDEAKKYMPWLPSFLVNTKARDWGIPLVCGWFVHSQLHSPLYLDAACFIFLWAALTTYWDGVFGYDNFFAHGLGVGLAYLPYALLPQISIIEILSRTLAIAVVMWVISKDADSVWIEEMGRGFVIGATLGGLL